MMEDKLNLHAYSYSKLRFSDFVVFQKKKEVNFRTRVPPAETASALPAQTTATLPGPTAMGTPQQGKPKVRLPCSMCEWKTNEGEGEELVGLLGHLRYHEMTHHGIVPSNVRQDPNNNSTTNEDGFGVAEMRDFRLTTAPRITPGGSDDRVTKFHEGRFLMGYQI